MNNPDLLKEIESNSDIIAYRRKIEEIENNIKAEYLQRQADERKKYKDWYSGLSEIDRLEEDIRISKENIRKLSEEKKRLKSKETAEDKRKERNHLLILLGVEVMTLCKKANISLTNNDISSISKALNTTYKNGDNVFIVQLKKYMQSHNFQQENRNSEQEENNISFSEPAESTFPQQSIGDK